MDRVSPTILNEDETQSKLAKVLEFAIHHYTLIFLLLTLVNFFYKVAFSPLRGVEAFILSFLVWNVGVRGIIAFIVNMVPPLADPIAHSYGWPLRSSFQREIAASEGAFGILGILCLWMDGSFWSAVIIGFSFSWFCSELGGLLKIAKRKKDPNYKLNLSLLRGMRLDFIFSIVLFICFIVWKLEPKI